MVWYRETISDEVDLNPEVCKAGYPKERAFLEVNSEMGALAVG